MKKYRVRLHSRSGVWEFYEGHVDIYADNEEEAASLAVDKLKRTSFPDRPRTSWRIDSVEVAP